MKFLSDDEIDYYIDNFKPYDKAGAYGIQEWIGIIACSHIDGSYFNVVGLPVQRLYKELTEILLSEKYQVLPQRAQRRHREPQSQN